MTMFEHGLKVISQMIYTSMSAELHEVDSLLENVEGSEYKVDEPNIGMMFAIVDVMYCYFKNYSKQMGFSVSRRTSRRGQMRH